MVTGFVEEGLSEGHAESMVRGMWGMWSMAVHGQSIPKQRKLGPELHTHGDWKTKKRMTRKQRREIKDPGTEREGSEVMICLCSPEQCDSRQVCTGLREISRLKAHPVSGKGKLMVQLKCSRACMQKAGVGEKHKQDIGRVLVSDLG